MGDIPSADDGGHQQVEIVDTPGAQRYEARVGDRVVGIAEYRRVDRDRVILFHTEIDPALEGQGIGGRLAAGVLDDIRARDLRLTVKCPFIEAFLKRHPEYADLQSRPAG
jgi:uncharacterized protein